MKSLYITRDEQYPEWQRYEVYDLSIKRTVLIVGTTIVGMMSTSLPATPTV